MRKILAGVLLAILMLGGASAAYAKAERMFIKDPVKHTKEVDAAAQIKNIDLQDIEDPAARKAIGEILNFLNVKSKK